MKVDGWVGGVGGNPLSQHRGSAVTADGCRGKELREERKSLVTPQRVCSES